MILPAGLEIEIVTAQSLSQKHKRIRFLVFGMLRSPTTAGDNFLTSIDNTQKLLLYLNKLGTYAITQTDCLYIKSIASKCAKSIIKSCSQLQTFFQINYRAKLRGRLHFVIRDFFC